MAVTQHEPFVLVRKTDEGVKCYGQPSFVRGHTIHRAFPQHAHIPFEDAGARKVESAAHHARFAGAVARYLFSHRDVTPRLLNRAYALPRLGYGLLRRKYRASHPWLSLLALSLFQLDGAAAGLAGAPALEPRRSVAPPVPDVIATAPAPFGAGGRERYRAYA